MPSNTDTMNKRPPSLLIVDDDYTSREILAARLRCEGYVVSVAVDGDRALEMMGVERYDVVILDLRMPSTDGYEVLERMKADPALATTPVIAVTAANERHAFQRCFELGVQDYVLKPVDTLTIKARVWRCLAIRRLQDKLAVGASQTVNGADVLVVDDESVNREILAMRMRGMGHKVREEAEGAAALAHLRARPFDLVLLDLKMPGTDGYEVLDAAAREGVFDHTAVIVVSVIDEEDNIARCLAAGAMDYVVKPFNPAEIGVRVSSCLQLKQLERQEAARAARLAELEALGRRIRGPRDPG